MKVFLSSTYLDLIEHRKVVVNALRPMGEEVGHMEIFGARNEEATKASLEELDKCDVLVGVYAYRYGTIPKGTKASVTELEYLHAMSMTIPVLVFVIEESHPWLPKLMDKNLTKINNFKSRITKEHTPDYFTFPDTLAVKVVASISRLAKKIEPKLTTTLSITVPRQSVNNVSTLPTQPFFFGREIELAKIADAISPESRTWGALIHGPGGVGKTALAIEAAHQAPSTLFDKKFFISAKERELTSKGEVSSKDFSHNNYFSILNELALQLGEDGLSRLAQEERANTLKNILMTRKTLIIIDNLETLNDDDQTRIYQFLTHLPHGNKAIVTNRHRVETDGRTIPLGTLNLPEAEKLISELAKRNPRLQDIHEKEKRELYQVANGNPLTIRWVMGQVGRDSSNIKTISEAIEFMRNAPEDNDPLEYVFGDLLTSSNQNELIVLATMTYLSHSPKAEWISNITGYRESEIEKVWDDLANRSILTAVKASKEYVLPDLTRQYIQKKLPKEITEIGKKLERYSRTIALEFGGLKNNNGLLKLEEKWPVISASLPYFLKQDNNDLQIMCDALDMFLKSTGLRDEWLWLNQQALITAENRYEFDNAGERAYKVGLIYSYLEQPNEVLQYATRAEKHWQSITTAKLSLKGKMLVSHLRGLSYKILGNYTKAIEIINDALETWSNIVPDGIEIRGMLLNTLGEIQVKEGELENASEKFREAEKNFEEAILIALQNGHKEEISVYKGNLANLSLKLGNWQKTVALASDALKLAEELGIQEEIARENLHLAVAYLSLGDGSPRGLGASQKAVEVYRRLRHKALIDAEAILMEWKK